MRVTLLQQDIVWADTKANQQRFEQAILKAPGADLYVLPEMWSTGFATHPEGIAEKECDSLRWMQEMAGRTQAALAGSIATEEEGRFYNRFYFVKPSSAPCHYDKRHLFSYGGEQKCYTTGQERVVVEWRGVRFLLQVCYDLRFPVFSRNEAEGPEAYDAILYVASWPQSRRMPWDTLLRARAIENQCYVCGVNRIGEDTACQYNGGTVLIDPYGRTMEACEDGKPDSISAELDMERLQAFRQKFPVLKDRDD